MCDFGVARAARSCRTEHFSCAANLGETMATDRIDIRHVARLARLALTDAEIATFAPQLGNLMTHVDALAQLDTDRVAATAQVVPSRNVQRDDALRPETILSREAALANAPQVQGPFFRVPRIIAEEG